MVLKLTHSCPLFWRNLKFVNIHTCWLNLSDFCNMKVMLCLLNLSELSWPSLKHVWIEVFSLIFLSNLPEVWTCVLHVAWFRLIRFWFLCEQIWLWSMIDSLLVLNLISWNCINVWWKFETVWICELHRSMFELHTPYPALPEPYFFWVGWLICLIHAAFLSYWCHRDAWLFITPCYNFEKHVFVYSFFESCWLWKSFIICS